jgi:hypothetical protein
MQIEVMKTVAARPSKAFETAAADAAPLAGGFRKGHSRRDADSRAVAGWRAASRNPPHVRAAIHRGVASSGDRAARRLRVTRRSHGLNCERDHIIDSLNVSSRLILTLRIRSASQTQAGRALTSFITPFIEINMRDELERPRRPCGGRDAISGPGGW